MPVTLSIKNVPDEAAQRLREIAAANHRSLQGELLATVLEKAGMAPPRMTPRQYYDWVRTLGLPSMESSVELIREMRDTRNA